MDNLLTGRKILLIFAIILNISWICHAQEQSSNDYFANIPPETLFETSQHYEEYVQLTCLFPDGSRDTLWLDRNRLQNSVGLSNGGLGSITNNTIISPYINRDDPHLTIPWKEGSKATVFFNNAIYPQNALKKEIEGSLSVNCIVEKDGSLSDINLSGENELVFHQEALRLLSCLRMNPCKIEERAFRCKFKMTLVFRVEEEKGKKGKKIGRVYIGDETNLPSGVSRVFTLGIINTETTKTGGSSWSKSWDILISVDVPENTPELETKLCEILFARNDNSIDKAGHKVANSFLGSFKHPEFKGRSGDRITIKANVLGFKKDKYYSYGYEIELGRYIPFSVSHNFIYDIENKRILTIDDLITPKEIEGIKESMGIVSFDNVDLGMNDYFLYIGRDGENIATIALTQENWDRFASHFQKLLGRKEALPVALNTDDFEEGTLFGIQPRSIRERIIRKPALGYNGMNLPEYLSDIWKEIEEYQDSDGFSAKMNYIIEKDNTLSHYDLKYVNGDINLFERFHNLIKNLPEATPLMTAVSGKKRTYQKYDIILERKPYDFVEQMPEYPGGFPAAFKWISENIILPDSIAKTGVKGRIYTSFIVEKDGILSNIEIANVADPSLEWSIKYVLMKMTKWQPGKKNGEPVRVKMHLPIVIRGIESDFY